MPTRNRKPTANRRSSNGSFGQEELAAFLAGEIVPCRSSNVTAAQWSRDTGTLILEFQGGEQYAYRPVDRFLAESFAYAPSKGGWRHDYFPKGSPGVSRADGWYHPPFPKDESAEVRQFD